MEDKQAIAKVFVPKAVLRPETTEATHAIPGGLLIVGLVGIRGFPFRIGRESRGRIVDGQFVRTERPGLGDREPNNDLYLVDPVPPLQISREHFQIERTAAGYLLRDRGSACGMSVGRTRIGGEDTGGSAPLEDGDVIGIGNDETPYRFTFIALD